MPIFSDLKRIYGIKNIYFTTSVSDIIPGGRRMNWLANDTVGVPGGIPTNRTIFVNVLTTDSGKYKCSGDGLNNDYEPLWNAVKDCPWGQTVYCPSGNYILTGRMLIQTNQRYTISGDGIRNTNFIFNNSSLGHFRLGASQFPLPTGNQISVTGFTTGSNIVLVTGATSINTGNFVYLKMTTPTWMHAFQVDDPHGSGIIWQMTFKVIDKTGTSVTLSHPIPFDVSDHNPTLIPWGNGGGGHVTNNIGLEDFSINLTSGASNAIQLEQAYGCWVKNVEISGSRGRQTYFNFVIGSEMRGCYTHDASGTGPNHEGIDFSQDCCFNLIEDNICVDGGEPAIIFGDSYWGCAGNVVGYNYIQNGVITGNAIFTPGIYDSHGAGIMLNLYEGNVIPGFTADGYFGSSSHGTVFRNFIHSSGGGQGPYVFHLDHYSNYYNIVGNVLGHPDNTSVYEMTTGNVSNNRRIWRLGFPNVGNNEYGDGLDGDLINSTDPPDYTTQDLDLTGAQAIDYNVSGTLIKHGNYVYSSTLTGVEWDSSISNHTFRNSYYLTSKPDWFGALAWPPIGSDLNPMTGAIPAYQRYLTY